MGIRDLITAFNSVTGGTATCTSATMDYSRANDTEWQILNFYGNWQDGTPFEIKGARVRPGGVLAEEAKATAQRLVDQGKPAT